MKFMIVTSNEPWGEGICQIAKASGFKETFISSHEQALLNFLKILPTHVLVGEYEYKGDKQKAAGSKFRIALDTWEDITNAASEDQVLRRCGFMNIQDLDFIRLPFNAEAFKKSFNLSL